MKIILGNDHAATNFKKEIAIFLEQLGHEVINLGTDLNESVNYPEFGANVAREVVKHPGSFGVVICGSGIGISIAANKIKGARAALVYEHEGAKLARKHNDANVIALGARFIAIEKAKELIKIFLNEKFEGGRHQKRVDMLNQI